MNEYSNSENQYGRRFSYPQENTGYKNTSSQFNASYPHSSYSVLDPSRPIPTKVHQENPNRPYFKTIILSAIVAIVATALTIYLSGTFNSRSTYGGTSTTVAAPPLTLAPGDAPNWRQVAANVEPSVVAIQVTSFNNLSGDQGSGVIWDLEGHIVTNHHVVASAIGGGRLQVLIGRELFDASIIGTDQATDLAVLKLEAPKEYIKPIVHADSSSLKVGDEVAAIGNPLGLSGTVTTGIVSAVDRPTVVPNRGGSPTITNAIQLSAALNPGNSGGALVNKAGQLVGINSAIATLSSTPGTGGNIGIGFAIPLSLASQIVRQIIKNGEVKHAYLGTNNSDGAAKFEGRNILGSRVVSVTPHSPADTGGIKKNDLIVEINKRPITSSSHLIGTVRTLQAGGNAVFSVVRNGQKIDLNIKMGEAPNN